MNNERISRFREKMKTMDFQDFKKLIHVELSSLHIGYRSLRHFRNDFMESNPFDPEIKAHEFGYRNLRELLESREMKEFVKIEKEFTNYGEPPIVIYKGREIDQHDSLLEAMKISEENKQKRAQRKKYWAEQNRLSSARGQNWGKQRGPPQNRIQFGMNSNNGQRHIVQQNCDEYFTDDDDEEQEEIIKQKFLEGINGNLKKQNNHKNGTHPGIFQKDSPNFHANPCSTEFLRKFDGMKMAEKSANENKCSSCREKDKKIASLVRENDALFMELQKSVACEKCIEARKLKLKENGNNNIKSKFALDGDLNGGNDDSPVGGQFNPIQMSTPKSTMEKNFKGKEMEIENATPNQQSISGFSSMISRVLRSPFNFSPNFLSFMNRSDPMPAEQQNVEENIENWNLDLPLAENDVEENKENSNPAEMTAKNIEGKKAIENGKAATVENAQEKVVPSNSNYWQRSTPTIIQNKGQLPKSIMEKGGGKSATAFRNGAGRKGRKLIQQTTETTIGSIDLEGQTWETDESDTTNNDGGEENGNEEEEHYVNVDEGEGNEEDEEEQQEEMNENEEVNEEEEENMEPAAPNPELYCQFCERVFGTPRGLKIHKSGKAHGRRVAEMNGEDNQIQCTQCDSRLSTLELLNRHISRMHKPKLLCFECGKAYTTQSGLNKHQQKEGHHA